MYRVRVHESARNDIAAAAAAHRELGPGYDEAVAEGLVERIGAEIDKRVDARLAERAVAESAAQRPAARPAWPMISLGLGSIAFGGFTAVALINAGASAALIVAMWIIIAVINVAYAWRR